MNRHTLGYGLSAILLTSSIMAGAYSLHTKSESIAKLKGENVHLKVLQDTLNAEKVDMGTTNSQLSEKVEKLESELNEYQLQIENLNKENQSLQTELNVMLENLAKETSGWSTFTATYYDANEISTGKTPSNPAYGITASGEPVKVGVTVAVDPRVIPLGSWVEVKYPDGRVEKRKATDTGRKIKGNKIDIYIAAATLTSGKHPVEVRIIN